MAQFKFKGREKTGKQKAGTISGGTKREAVAKLREKGIRVLEIEEVPQSILTMDIHIGNPVKLQDFVIFLRQFSTLLQAGITVVDSTKVLAAQTESKMLKQALSVVEEDLRSGMPLSEASAKHKKVFPPMYINMIRAGEVGGNMDETLDRLADHYEKQHQTRKKVQAALSYPIVVGIVAIGVVIFLLSNVVPTFAAMFRDFGGELPAITKFVLSASEWMQTNWWLILLALIVILSGFFALRKNTSSRFYVDYAILKMPIFGKLLQKSLMARMARTLSSLFSSSVPILQAIAIVEKIVDNDVMVRVLKQSRESLEKGQSLTDPMKKHWVFPPLVTQMIAIGEETGSLDLMLSKVADFYEVEVENATDQLKSLIEPLMIVFLASIVGTIVLAIMVPMFEIFNQVDSNF